MAEGAGPKTSPWQLTTAPGSVGVHDVPRRQASPPALVCQVGSTTLRYRTRGDRRPARLAAEQGDWMPLGAADEKKDAA